MSKVIAILVAIFAISFFVKRASNKKKAASNIESGNQFLLENKSKEGVVTTESGLQYCVMVPSENTQKPTRSNQVSVHYHGTLIDGTVFDSSVDRGQPITFGLTQVIPGWTEGLQTMVVGEKKRLFIPAELAYKNVSAGIIPAGSTLIFDVELLDIN
jgi:peptidylprolyl isomerase